MTIVYDEGNIWIETHSIGINTNDAAGRVASVAVPPDRVGGTYLAGSVTCRVSSNNDNSQTVGQVELLVNGGSPSVGSVVATIQIRVNKTIGTAGVSAQSYLVSIMFRQTH